ncbi:MAG: hypothetical protein ABI806_15225 [Candidatus Solibacter sp.]
MQTTWVLFGIISLAGMAEACTVQVRISNTAIAGQGMIYQAKSIAADMFVRIGVKLEFTSTARPHTCGKPIEIRFETGNPGAERPDSLAYAMPYLEGGTSIHVFVERVAAMAPANCGGVVLGHVLAHEITHVLQGAARHSDHGVMKAHWDAGDFRAMQSRALPFAPLDVLLLQAAGMGKPTTDSTLAAAN